MEELYEKLYHMLFNACTDCVNALEAGEYARAHSILFGAQRACEETYLSWEEAGGGRAGTDLPGS